MLRGYLFKDSEGVYEMFLDSDTFNPLVDSVVSPRTEELCKSIPAPFVGKVKNGGYRSGKAHAGHIIESQKTLGSLAEKNSRPNYVADMEGKRKEEVYQSKLRRWEYFEKRLNNPLPKPQESYRPWWRKSDSPNMHLNKLTPEEKVKYQNEGKLPIGLKDRGKPEKNNE